MPALAKLLIGLAAALLVGWISHGPLGQGEAYVARLEAQAQAVVREAEIPGVALHFARDPLARQARLSGPADSFQREGRGLFPGLNDRILGLAGVGSLRWSDEPGAKGGTSLPLLAETLLQVLLFFALGLGIGWRLFRPRHQGYL